MKPVEGHIRVDVESPSDVQWERMEQRLFEARDRELAEQVAAPAAVRTVSGSGAKPRRVVSWPVFAGGALAAAASATLVVWLASDGGGGESGPDKAARTAPVRPTRIVTPAGGGSRVELGGATLQVGPATELEVDEQPGGQVVVRLARGRVSCDVTPRANRPPFLVLAGDVTVKVVGTLFTVERDESVRVSVARGKVTVESDHDQRALAAGESWTRKGSELAVAAPSGPGPGPEPGPEPGPGPGPAAGPGPEPEPGLEPGPKPEPEPGPAAGRKSDPRRADLKRARQLRADQPNLTAEILRRLANDSDRIAQIALYELAHLELFRLRRPLESLTLTDEYARRFPRGRERGDALWLRMESYVDADQRDNARRAAREYLRRFPGEDKADRAYEVAGR